MKHTVAKQSRHRFQKALEREIGLDYPEKTHILYLELTAAAKEHDLSLLEIAYKSGLSLSTVGDFLLRAEFRTTPMSPSRKSLKRITRSRKTIISPKTYKALRKFTDKLLKK
jgi:hypothetical protein